MEEFLEESYKMLVKHRSVHQKIERTDEPQNQ